MQRLKTPREKSGLKKGLSERVLNAELDAHLDAETADGKTNRHNGRSQKTVLTGTSKVTLDIPRDRAGTFDPQLIAKYQRRFPDFDQKIISMYARGTALLRTNPSSRILARCPHPRPLPQ